MPSVFALRVLRRSLAVTTLVVCASLQIWACPNLHAADLQHDATKSAIKFFGKYCLDCHGAENAEADLALDEITESRLAAAPDMLRGLINVIEREEMPPEDQTQPSANERSEIASVLTSLLHESIAKQAEPVRTSIRRMNRFQYNNAVTDLLGLKVSVFTLPERMMREHNDYFQPESGMMADVVQVGSRPLGKSQMIEPRLAGVAAFPQDLRAEHGYDNQADHLSLSPLLMEAFLNLGQSITNSPDFTPKNVGLWGQYFEAPDQDLDTALEDRIEKLTRHAFRRRVDQDTVRRYAEYASGRIGAGQSFTAAMKSVVAAVIASPRFLYLRDAGLETELHQKESNDFAIASRLSFFLWGSLPDDELLRLADLGQLDDPEVLGRQVDRMLKDKKVKRFCDSFPSQWLQLDRIISSVPDRERFPQFYFSKYRDSMHMMLEPLLLFETVLIEDRSIRDLLDPDFSYRSLLLEDAYGALRSESEATKEKRGAAVGVIRFYRVPITDRRSGGVITNAAVMTMTSGPERTQPITRGAWVAGVIFNDPPEPPPADVPSLDENESKDTASLTLRERLAMHRERSDCRGCHEQIDPLGFALENYDPVGVWRDKYASGREVDVAGRLFRRHSFDSVVEFKDAILTEEDRFAKAFTGHLMSFALARQLSTADELAVDQIVDQKSEKDFRIKSLIRRVVLSEPFVGNRLTRAVVTTDDDDQD